MKNKVVAALLAFFGGWMGLHKFYLRDSGAGIFYIFLSMMTVKVFPVSFLLSVIDGLRYLMMSPEDFDRKFNRQRGRTRGRSNNRGKVRKYDREATRRSTRTSRQAPNSKKRGKTTRVRSNPFKKSGLIKYKEYDIEEAIIDFQKALKIDPSDASLHFNLACAYSLLEDKDAAFKYIASAVQLGMTDVDRILKHDDLAFIRIQPEFEEFRTQGFRIKHNTSTEDSSSEKSANKPMDDILLAQLNRLMELRKKGVLTEQEFIRERKKVLAR